jgi:signal transduction histidine kinase
VIQLPNILERINSKILLKITLLVIVEIVLIVSSFGVLAYFQSQQISLGNSINIAGKNRYLSSNLLLQTEKYFDRASNASQLRAAVNGLQSNIITLKQGGIISGVDLKPLSSDFLDLWNIINGNWNLYKTSVTQIMPYQGANATISLTLKATTKDEQFRKKQFESMASDLIASSDRLVNQLALQTDKNSNDLILLQTLFAVLIVSILILILYLVARMLKPIFDLTQATSKINHGNFDVTVRQRGRDELWTLTQSFNSMAASIRELIKNHCDLTRKLELANEELKRKDQLKNEFIDVAAHELRTPIQPILGLAELLRRRKSGDAVGGSKQEIEQLDTIIRNAKKLLRLEQNMLDMTKIEDRSLKLDKEKFDLIQNIQHVINDFGNESSNKKIQLIFTQPSEPIFINADKVRISEVISNLLGNAIKFTTREAGTDITINAEKKNNEAKVSIKDTGSGINPEIKPKLFSKFVTNSPGGTGIGLFISKSIIEAHGGRIWAENNANGKGATFVFSLPLNELTHPSH